MKIAATSAQHCTESISTKIRTWLKLFLPFLFLSLLAKNVSAQSFGTDFSQSSNNNPSPQGNVVWIGSIVQQSNSHFYEGQSTLQRILFQSVPVSSDGWYHLRFRHQAAKGSINAYDFVVGWGDKSGSVGSVPAATYIGAIETSNAISPTCFITLNQCNNLGPKGTQCPTFSTVNYIYATPVSATAMAGAGGVAGTGSNNLSTLSNVNARIAQFDADNSPDGINARRITLQANRNGTGPNLITSAVLTFLGYDAGSDQYAQYDLMWQGPSTGAPYDMEIKLAGHISQQIASNGTGYGVGKGAANISGGTYHFKLDNVYLTGNNPFQTSWSSANTVSIGNQDNQLKGADILIPPPPCDITPTTSTICAGQTSGIYSGPTGMDAYAWTISPSTGVTLSATNTQTVTVNTTSAASGTYTLTLVTTYQGV